jgi:sugar-specific transcriptional regulator TrmB
MLEQEALLELGLTDHEAKVYLANLRLGSARVEEIAKRAGVLRTTCYDILKSLVEKGFAGYVIKSGVKYYSAADPKKLLSILDEKRKRVQEVLPALEAMKESVLAKPKIELFEGKEGIKSAYERMMAAKAEVMGYGNAERSWGFLVYYLPAYVRRRVKAGIKSRLILEKSARSEEIRNRDTKEKRQTRFLPAMKGMEAVVYIFGDKIAMMTFVQREPIAVIIENKEIADSQRIIFEALWKTAK